MRDYLTELSSLGLSLRDVAEQSHISLSYVKRLAAGKSQLKSGTRVYEALRNTTRRQSYRVIREQGLPAGQAREYRRTYANPESTPIEKTIVRKVESRTTTGSHQYYILGRFQARLGNGRYGEIRIEYGFTPTYRSKNQNIEKMIKKAIENAKAKLGGTNWELRKIIEQGWVDYVLTRSAA